MKRLKTLWLVAFWVLVLAPLAAEAAGEVKGVTAPSSATKGTAVTITVTGQPAVCQSLDLDYGDGTAHATYTGPLPKSFSHTYSSGGTKTITAKGVNSCKGQATASILVKSYLATLCASTNCERPVFTFIPPKIDSVFLFSDITPGGFVVVVGQHFGTTKGRFFLKGLQTYWKKPYGDVELSVIASDWNKTVVGGTIPSSKFIFGVMDQAAASSQGPRLQIKTAANQWSNEFPVNFRATREIKPLPPGDIATRVIRCGPQSNYSECSVTAGPAPRPTFVGGHSDTGSGTDAFGVYLKRGWFLDSMDWYLVVTEAGEAGATKPSFPSGKSVWEFQIPWYVTPGDAMHYGIYVYIAGPIGVPWH